MPIAMPGGSRKPDPDKPPGRLTQFKDRLFHNSIKIIYGAGILTMVSYILQAAFPARAHSSSIEVGFSVFSNVLAPIGLVTAFLFIRQSSYHPTRGNCEYCLMDRVTLDGPAEAEKYRRLLKAYHVIYYRKKSEVIAFFTTTALLYFLLLQTVAKNGWGNAVAEIIPLLFLWPPLLVSSRHHARLKQWCPFPPCNRRRGHGSRIVDPDPVPGDQIPLPVSQ